MPQVALQLEGVGWHLDRDEAPTLAPELARLTRELAAGRLSNRKSGRRKELYSVELAMRGAHLLKVNRYPGARGWWRRLRGSKARREQRIARALADRGLPVPVPLAWGERGGARLEACYLLVPRVPGVVDLSQVEGDRALASTTRQALARAFGTLSRRLHDAGLQQEDFAPNNFLVRLGPRPELFVVDFERARLGAGPVRHRHRLDALARLDRRLPGVSNAERWRFLVAYAGGPGEARRWWWELATHAPALAARDLARLRRRSTREGRRIVQVHHGAGSGWAQRGVVLGELLRAGGTPDPGTWRRGYPETSPRRARELWAVAQLLWRRGLGARPLALLRNAAGSVLWLERESGARELHEARDPERAMRAAEILLGRLLSLGSLDRGLESGEIAVIVSDHTHLRAVLLAPERLRIGHSPAAADRLREARQRARSLGNVNP